MADSPQQAKRKAALRQLIIDKNPNTQAAIMMIAVDLALVDHVEISTAMDRAVKFWDKILKAECKRMKIAIITWTIEEQVAAEFIRGLRRSNASWRVVLERGTQ